jgi:tetratricopeptide (TPR) repeat protein
MITVLCFVFLGSFPNQAHGNSKGTSELQSKRLVKDPFELISEARAIYMKDALRALDLAEEALLIALRNNNTEAQAAAYWLVGDINLHLKQYDLSLSNYQRAIRLYKQLDGAKNQLLQLYKLSGEAYQASEMFSQALLQYQSYLDLDDQKEKSKLKSLDRYKSSEASSKKEFRKGVLSDREVVQLAMAEIYRIQKRYAESASNVNRLDTANAPEKQLILNEKLGDLRLEQQDEDAAIEYYDKNIEVAQKIGNQEEEGKAIGKKADVYSQTNQLEEASDLRERSISILNLTEDTNSLAKSYLELGDVRFKLLQFSKAEDALQQTITLARVSKQAEAEAEAYRLLSLISEKRGDDVSALAYLKKHLALQDAAFEQKRTEMEAKLSLNSSITQKQNQIELLEKNEELNDKTIAFLQQNEALNQQRLRTQRLTIYGLSIGLLLLALSAYFFYRNMRQKRLANQLLALKALRTQMNPHFIFNALNSVNHYIAQKDERAANKYLSEFSQLMRAVLEYSQQDFISLQKEIDIISLYIRLEHYRFADKFEYELYVDKALDKENLKIPPMLVQPYVENAVWHGLRYIEGKGKLTIAYHKTEEGLEVVIEDNGIGRLKSQELKTENQRQKTSLGMHNTSQRIQILNEMVGSDIKVMVEDIQPQGTRIKLQLNTANF